LVVAYCTTLKIHIWPSAKSMSMLHINPESDGERLLSHIENWDTSQSLLDCKGYSCLQRLPST
jgi:hypothetical protein